MEFQGDFREPPGREKFISTENWILSIAWSSSDSDSMGTILQLCDVQVPESDTR